MVKKSVEVDQAILMTEIKYIRQSIDELQKKLETLDQVFVSKHEWEPVRNIVFGVVALILTAVATAVTALVVRR